MSASLSTPASKEAAIKDADVTGTFEVRGLDASDANFAKAACVVVKSGRMFFYEDASDKLVSSIDAATYPNCREVQDPATQKSWLTFSPTDASKQSYAVAFPSQLLIKASSVWSTPKRENRKSRRKTKTLSIGAVDPRDSAEVQKLKLRFTAKEELYEKQRITVQLDLEQKIEERITSLKIKMNEDLKAYGEEDTSIIDIIVQKTSNLFTLLADHLAQRTLHFHTFKKRKTRDVKEAFAKILAAVGDGKNPNVAECQKALNEMVAVLEVEVQNDVKKYNDEFDKSIKLREAEMSTQVTSLEQSKQTAKMPHYIEQYQLTMGVLKFIQKDTSQSLSDELDFAKNEVKEDIAFITELFKK